MLLLRSLCAAPPHGVAGSPGDVPCTPWPGSNLSPTKAAGGGSSCAAGLAPTALASIVPTASVPAAVGAAGTGMAWPPVCWPTDMQGQLWERDRLGSKALECSSCSGRSGN